MFNQILVKQQRAVSVVKAALLNAGLHSRQVSAGFDSWTHPSGSVENFAVFISAPEGSNIEPCYVTGKTIVEAVRKMIDSIKKKRNSAYPVEKTEEAPF